MIQTVNPPLLFKNKHIQTILPLFLPTKIVTDAILKKTFISTHDQATLVISSHIQRDSPEAKDDILLIHGLEGSAESSYMLRIAHHALQKNFNVHRMNLRGCGESLPYNALPYHAGLWQDVWEVCRRVKTGRRLFLVGFSLGGNLVLKMAGELGAEIHSYITGMISVSGAIDMAASAAWLDQNPIYQRYLLWFLMKSYQKRCVMFPDTFRGLLVHRPQNIRDFDDQITARLHGFGHAAEYYAQTSSCSVLHKIQIPTLLIYAVDDPMVPCVPYQHYMPLFQASQYLHLVQTPHGGHVGFLGPGWGQTCINTMMEDFICHF